MKEFRLPHTFNHWIYNATGGKYMMCDIQGWKIADGQYVLSDPIIFSSEKNYLGLIDHGDGGIKSIMSKHKCNEICKIIPIAEDTELIQQIEDFKERFERNDFTKFEENLKIVLDILELNKDM